MNVVLCEPYFTGSHRSWAEGLARHSRHDVTLVTHAGGFWKWRMQGAALTLARELDAAAHAHGPPDVVLVSDMVHVAALMGLARRTLAEAPVVLYLHENQLTYPLAAPAEPQRGTAPEEAPGSAPPARGEAPEDHTYAMTNWLSMAAADHVVFNSEFHRRQVLDALPRLLRRFPDHRHTGLVADVAERATVLPVGVEVARFAGRRPADEGADPPLVLWNHRWEYDKDPEAFFAALDTLAEQGVAFRVAVAGERYHRTPEVFERARQRLGERVVHFGTAAEEAYADLLRSSDVVVSTSRHEFFGLAVVEAMAAGALPVLPDRLSYPELLPDPSAPYLYRSPDGLAARLRWALTDHDGRRAAAARTRRHVQRFGWDAVAPRYDALLTEVATRPRPSR